MGSNNREVRFKITYGVDLVFCIDATQSMSPILGTVKDNALRLYKDFKEIMEQHGLKAVIRN